MDSVAINLVGQNTDTAVAYPKVFSEIDAGAVGSRFVLRGWTAWRSSKAESTAEPKRSTAEPKRRPVSGKILELLVVDALWLAGVAPIYYQVSLSRIPRTAYDVLVCGSERLYAISCKASLRERWSQSALEASILRRHYAGAHSVLLTLDRRGHASRRRIEEGTMNGLDDVVVVEAERSAFDDLVEELSRCAPQEAGPSMQFVRGKMLTESGEVVKLPAVA